MTEYILTREELPDVERARLRLLEEYHDPLRLRQLDAISVGEGWRCLDVGAGSVTRMLAERVDSTGSVLAVDLDTSLLEPLANDRIEVRRLDLLSDPLPKRLEALLLARTGELRDLPDRDPDLAGEAAGVGIVGLPERRHSDLGLYGSPEPVAARRAPDDAVKPPSHVRQPTPARSGALTRPQLTPPTVTPLRGPHAGENG